MFTEKSNLPEFTVSEISGSVRKTLETRFSHIRVRGEVTECKYSAQGHVYYSLKDEQSRLNTIIWRSQRSRLTLQPEDGMDVVVTGRISSYAKASRYQLITEDVTYAGVGAMLARIEKLRKELAVEGLFDPARKKELPFLPKTIAVITSPQGAVIHDICTTLKRRFPRNVLLWPVAVQGEGAADQIRRALEGFCATPSLPIQHPPDVIIVARGGGSVEELLPFSDEGVVRAASDCPIPIISAVGHETDNPLIDEVADCRAPTPTAAAEMAVPVRGQLQQTLEETGRRGRQILQRILRDRAHKLRELSSRLPSLLSLTREANRTLQAACKDLRQVWEMRLQAEKVKLNAVALPSLRTIFQACQHKIWRYNTRLESAMQTRFQQKQFGVKHIKLPLNLLTSRLRAASERYQNKVDRLEALSPYSILERGYVLVTKRNGKPVTKAAGLKNNDKITLRFADGSCHAQIKDGGIDQGELALGSDK